MPSSKEKPFHLGMHLMEQGIPTIFTLGDKEFIFNKPNSPKQ
jgi:hypothetical protein